MKLRDELSEKILQIIIEHEKLEDGNTDEAIADFILSKDTLELLKPLYEIEKNEAKNLFEEHSRNFGDYIPDYNYDRLINALSDVVEVRKEI